MIGLSTYALRINPRPLSALELKLSGLIMESRVDTVGDNQNAHVIISNYLHCRFWIPSDVSIYLTSLNVSHLRNSNAYGSNPQFYEHFSVNFARSAKIDNSSVKSGEQSDFSHKIIKSNV